MTVSVVAASFFTAQQIPEFVASLRGLRNSCEKKGSENQRRKGKIYPFECRVPKNSKER